MADINVERKGPSIWPWIIGLLVLALLIWAIAEMVDTDEEEMAAVEEVREPAAVPAPAPAPVPPEAAELETLAPLGSDDVGRMARIDGQVVGQPMNQGFWVRTGVNDQQHVIFVQAPAQTRDGRMLQAADVRSGQDVDVVGTLQQAPADQISGWADQAQLRTQPDYQRWNVHQDLMLSSAQPGMQPGQPGAQPMQPMQPQQPADTVQGRY